MERYYKKYSKFLVFPAVFLFICVVAIPFAIGLLYSFTSWRGTYFANGTLMESFVGLDNYMKVFTNAQFGKSFLYTCCYTVLSVITINICALLLALMVTSITKGAGLFRTVLFMPNMLGGLALGFIWQFIFQVVFTDILFGPGGVLHIEGLRFMTQSPVKALFALLIMTTWQNAGYMMIIYIAGLQNVPDDLIEAAEIDGAAKWDILWKIRVPMVMSSITICVFLTLTNSFKLFDQNLALTGGDPNHATEMLALNIYQTFYARAGMQWKGYGQAKAVIFCALVIIISLVQLKATRSKEVQQ